MARVPLDERRQPDPGSPPVAPYVYVNTLGLYLPVGGTDLGDGSASMAVVGTGVAPGSSVVRIEDGVAPGQVDVALGRLQVDVQAAVESLLRDNKRAVTDYRTLLDYGAGAELRVDDNPVYVGANLQASLIGAGDWSILKLFYDSLARLVDKQVLVGAWTARTTLAWKPAGGD